MSTKDAFQCLFRVDNRVSTPYLTNEDYRKYRREYSRMVLQAIE